MEQQDKPPEAEALHIENAAVLDCVKQWNAEGKHVIFAPNHLCPSTLLAVGMISDDYFHLRKALRQHGVHATPVIRADLDMPIGNNPVLGKIYDVSRRVFSALERKITGGITLGVNVHEPDRMSVANVPAAREILRTAKENNLVLYPYGNWFKPREQEFDPAKDLDDGSGFVRRKQDFPRWRTSLKKGTFATARMTGNPVVPVYVEYEGKHWTITFGEPILPPTDLPKHEAELAMAKEYLAEMQRMRFQGK